VLPACVSPTDVAEAERTLVHHAGAVDAGIVVKLGQRIADYLNPDGLFSDEDRARRRGLHLGRQGADGMSRLSGLLDPEARAYFGLDQRLPTLLVSGGSQGARRLNETVQAIAPRLQQYGVQILHAVGPKNEIPRIDDIPGMPPYRALPYRDPDLPAALLPPGWPGREAHTLFLAAHDALYGPAAAFVRDIVSR